VSATPREVELRERLVDLAVEVQAHGHRLKAYSVKSATQAQAVLGAALAMAAAARKLGAGSGHETLNLFFPPRDKQTANGETEDDDGSE
jgi:hypothetical protein